MGDEGFLEAEVVPQVVVEEEAMAAQAGGIAGDGGVGGADGTGDLSEGGALGEEGGDGDQEVGSPKPVVGREGTGGEAVAAEAAGVDLYAAPVGAPEVGAALDVVPVGVGVMGATVGAMGRVEAPVASDAVWTVALHAGGK